MIAGLRLLGIGRNQYIDLMNECRSSKVYHLLPYLKKGARLTFEIN